ncbi:MAG: SirB2 family protein [bacterium]
MLLTVHVTAVILSLTGFLGRGLLMIRESPWLHTRPAKVLPHVVDTVLLGSAIGLVFMRGFYPWEQPWLLGKIIGLLLYILIGTVAIKRGKTKTVRVVAWLLALAVFANIVLMALTHQLPPRFGY